MEPLCVEAPLPGALDRLMRSESCQVSGRVPRWARVESDHHSWEMSARHLARADGLSRSFGRFSGEFPPLVLSHAKHEASQAATDERSETEYASVEIGRTTLGSIRCHDCGRLAMLVTWPNSATR